MQPGETITPGAQPPTPNQAPPLSEQPPATRPDLTQPTTPSPPPPPAEPETPSWNYNADQPPEQAAQPDAPTVSWTASEYIAHSKNPGWFVLLGLGLFVVMAAVFFLTKSILSTIMVGIAGLSFGVFAARQPKVLQYRIDSSGVHIGNRLFPYQELRSFTSHQEGGLPSIMLYPLKRFLPPITIFYDPQNEDDILASLGSYLPLENKQPDAVDRLMKRIRF